MENRLSEVLAVIPRASLDCLVRGLEMLNKALEETGYTETT